MRSPSLSLPFLGLYLFHAWLFTFDVLLLSRRRARTPVAVGTLCVLLGTLLYVVVTCGNLPKLDVRIPQIDFNNLRLPDRSFAKDRPASFWSFSSGNYGASSCGHHVDSTENINKHIPSVETHLPVSAANSLCREEAAQIKQQTQPPPQEELLNGNSRDPDIHFRSESGASVAPIGSACIQCPDNKDWFVKQLAHLSRQVDRLQTQVENCDCGSQKVSQAGQPDIDAAIQRALRLYDADKTGMADYALESAGGSVLSTRCTETYDLSMGRYYLFGFFPLFWQRPSPRLAIQPTLAVGQCWPFKGSIGYLVIRLSRRIKVEAFTLEHIPASVAPAGNIDSAPNHFEVFGLENVDDTEGVLLGSYNYTTAGEPLQHFKVTESVGDRTFDKVELKILTNHGNIHYTCLYRFRVHGKPVHTDDVW